VPVAEQSKLTMRYMEEFDRYVAGDHDDPPLLQRAADAG
jgi:hypothetical protein